METEWSLWKGLIAWCRSAGLSPDDAQFILESGERWGDEFIALDAPKFSDKYADEEVQLDRAAVSEDAPTLVMPAVVRKGVAP